jgi:hypothetical protein
MGEPSLGANVMAGLLVAGCAAFASGPPSLAELVEVDGTGYATQLTPATPT